MSPLEKHFGRSHDLEINELLCFENLGQFIMEHVADLDGLEVWDNTWSLERIGDRPIRERERPREKQASRGSPRVCEAEQIC